jgi:hypothetical protein
VSFFAGDNNRGLDERGEETYAKLTNHGIGVHPEGKESKKLCRGAAEAAPTFRFPGGGKKGSHEDEEGRAGAAAGKLIRRGWRSGGLVRSATKRNFRM